MDILVVDDNVELLKHVHGFLSDAGHEVASAESGEHALQVVTQKNCSFDVVVTDLAMPGMNGIELWDELKKILPHAKVLFISACPAEFMEGYVPGAFLSKPFSLRDLHERVLRLADPSWLQSAPVLRKA
jgi:CheY-like chemotaxis protein